MDKIIKIRLVKSLIGRPKKYRRIVKSLGLNKIDSNVSLKDSLVIRGMIDKISHLIKVEELNHGS